MAVQGHSSHVLEHEERAVSPQETMMLLVEAPDSLPRAALGKSVISEFLTLQDSVFYLPNNLGVWLCCGPSTPFFHRWNGLWSHFPSHCSGLQNCLDSPLSNPGLEYFFILPLLRHLQCLQSQWSIRTRPNGRPSGWDTMENRTSYHIPTACACH